MREAGGTVSLLSFAMQLFCRSGVINKRSYTEEEANLVLSTLLEIILDSKYDKAAQASSLVLTSFLPYA